MTLSDFFVKLARESLGKKDGARMAKQTPPDGVEVKEYFYSNDGDAMHRLNVYRPTNEDGVLPLVFDIHGGAWIYGDKELNRYYCMYLASKGYAVVNMSYRLLPYTDLRGQVQDIFAAARFVCGIAQKEGLDTNRVMLTGDSAGAHLSCLFYCINEKAELAELYGVERVGFDVKCMVLSHGVCDIHEMVLTKKDKKNPFAFAAQKKYDSMMFGAHPTRSPLYAKSSLEEVADGVNFPPVMIIGCERDVYLMHTLRLKRFFENRSPKFLYHFVNREEGPYLGHVYNILRFEWEESVKANDRSLAFFDECCSDKDTACGRADK